jgi:lipoate synthase
LFIKPESDLSLKIKSINTVPKTTAGVMNELIFRHSLSIIKILDKTKCDINIKSTNAEY